MPTQTYSPKTPKQLRDAIDDVEDAAVAPTTELSAVLDASNLPTSDPLVAGQVWNNAGVLTVSAG